MGAHGPCILCNFAVRFPQEGSFPCKSSFAGLRFKMAPGSSLIRSLCPGLSVLGRVGERVLKTVTSGHDTFCLKQRHLSC